MFGIKVRDNKIPVIRFDTITNNRFWIKPGPNYHVTLQIRGGGCFSLMLIRAIRPIQYPELCFPLAMTFTTSAKK